MAEVLKLPLDLISNITALTPTCNHGNSPLVEFQLNNEVLKIKSFKFNSIRVRLDENYDVRQVIMPFPYPIDAVCLRATLR